MTLCAISREKNVLTVHFTHVFIFLHTKQRQMYNAFCFKSDKIKGFFSLVYFLSLGLKLYEKAQFLVEKRGALSNPYRRPICLSPV